MAQTVAAASEAGHPTGVHLDHCQDFRQIQQALDYGYSSVMVNGSHLPLQDNVELTARVVALAAEHGAWVEAELGTIPGDEHTSTDAVAGESTDPETARRFVETTGVAALAVAVGNVHGFTATPTRLDLEALRAIHEACLVPLVLHGASRINMDELQAAVRSGVAKINVNTELRRAYLSNIDTLQAAESGWAMEKVMAPAMSAVSQVAESKMFTLWPNGVEGRQVSMSISQDLDGGPGTSDEFKSLTGLQACPRTNAPRR